MTFISAPRVSALALLATATALFAQTTPVPAPQAVKGYSLGIFARGVAGKYTAPDSIAVDNTHVFVGFGDGHKPDGSDGKNTQVVQYSRAGMVEHIYSVAGHNDGLKIDPTTHLLWALQNEDANPNIYLINTTTYTSTKYTFQALPAAGGGYDDIAFRLGKVYLSASNPAHNPNAAPAIVQARLENHTIAVTPVLLGNAAATDVVTGAKVTLNLQDPDSMTLDPSGDLFLTSQADAELIVVRKPGQQAQSVLQIPLTSPFGTPQVDDTLFIPDSEGYVLIADKDANTIYSLHHDVYVPGAAYSAAQVATPGSPAVSFLGKLDPEFGILTPVVTGLGNPGGLAYVQTDYQDTVSEEILEFCQQLVQR